MNRAEMKCSCCGGKSFVEAMDFINLRPVNKKMSYGTERVYTVCMDCGEVVSIKVKNPEMLRKY